MTFLLLVCLIAALDVAAVWGIKKTFPKFSARYQQGIWVVFGVQIMVSLLIVAGGYFWIGHIDNYQLMASYYQLFGFLMAVYFPKVLYALFLITDRLIALCRQRRARKQNLLPCEQRHLLAKYGLAVAVLSMLVIVWGILVGRYNYTVEPVEIFFDNLPESFEGYKIVQISDIHAGSNSGKFGHFDKLVEMINAQSPDLIVLTGDIVNNFSEELAPLEHVFSQLQAKDGKYAVLGNHDYGGYYQWKNPADSLANHIAIKHYISMMGFELLNNRAIVISRDSINLIALAGVENWGILDRFPKRADIERAIQSVANIPFKILLSHDPDYWEEHIKGKIDVALTLSGHSHGMQMGIKLGQRRFGLSNIIHRYRIGLYQYNNQYLYINRGLGVVAFPGRIGMPPEITVITLQRVK
ncbi:MAG: metallophosphoesterase [Bacteroidales bacterium]|nr:metallophosphoesterase [Bacteroidales bacterium]MCL2129858.1 metallophosphoesterase [Treponema sp.]